MEGLAGPAGVLASCGGIVANCLAVSIGSYLLTASAGPAFPESYQHNDGGTYRGEWRGLSKEGLGLYRSGGTYEGEWAGGVMCGTGLRTYSSGKVTSGRWENGQLVAPLELWQCATAAEGAAEAALAARR
eukprot:gene5296-5531_t